MNNYQLLSTNVLLGGQMKWNLQVKSYGEELRINDFFLSPISKWVSYSKPDRQSLNYSHDENIKDLYNSIKGDFFETKLDPRLNTKMPIITETPQYEDTYCDMYDMGVSRISKTHMGKSLQVFCPLWLEDFNEDSVITFRIGIFTKQTTLDESGEKEVYFKNTDITKDLKLTFKNNCDYHNKFITYFKNYIKSITEQVGDKRVIGDKLINIDFDNSYMSIEGISVENGKKINRDISYILPNLISRFRPMMDVDNIIISNFANNNLISKQLFNFNLIFDIEDILPHQIYTQLMGEKMFFGIKCFIGNEELPIKSFSCDYSKDFNIKDSNPLSNTLDFFEDYNSLQLMDKNKLSPQIIHWASTYDNDYIFNLYPDAVWNTNLWGTNVEDDNLCMHWCNNDLMFQIPSSYKYNIDDEEVVKDDRLLALVNELTPLENYSTFKPGKVFINNVLYDYNKGFSDKKIYINVIENLISDSRINANKNNIYKLSMISSKNNANDKTEPCGYIYVRTKGYYNILIDKKYINALSFNIMKEKNAKYIDNIKKEKNAEYIDAINIFEDGFKLSEFLNSVQNSKILAINNSVSTIKADSPTIAYNKTTEINYGKTIIPTHYLFRIDGHIKPAFVNDYERKYYAIKKITKEEYNENWDKFVKTKFPALYSSIGYFFITDIVENDYDIEKRWFNDSEVFILSESINLTIEKNIKENPEPIKENLINLLKSYYNIKEDKVDKVIEYIYNLYDISIYFDYLYKNSIDDYKYIIKMTLK